LEDIVAGTPVLGEGWSYAGGRAFQWAAPTTEVNPALAFSGVVPGATYRVIIQVTEFTGTGNATVTLGDAGSPIATITGVQTIDWVGKANVVDDLFKIVINTNATVTSLTIKNLFVELQGPA
jgi:hypothetical protein